MPAKLQGHLCSISCSFSLSMPSGYCQMKLECRRLCLHMKSNVNKCPRETCMKHISRPGAGNVLPRICDGHTSAHQACWPPLMQQSFILSNSMVNKRDVKLAGKGLKRTGGGLACPQDRWAHHRLAACSTVWDGMGRQAGGAC